MRYLPETAAKARSEKLQYKSQVSTVSVNKQKCAWVGVCDRDWLVTVADRKTSNQLLF